MKLWQIDNEIRLLSLIVGVNSAGEIFFLPEATSEERAAATAKMAELLPSLEPTGAPA